MDNAINHYTIIMQLGKEFYIKILPLYNTNNNLVHFIRRYVVQPTQTSMIDAPNELKNFSIKGS